MFENTKTFGPLIKIVIVMTQTLIKFFAVWALEILLFACVAMILFAGYPRFVSINSTIYYLLCGAIGNWDTSTFDLTNLTPVAASHATENELSIGRAFLLIFQIFNVVLMLNLVIALLASTYSNLSQYSLGLYYDSLVR